MRTSIMNKVCFALGLVAFALLTGCGKGHVGMGGRVTFSDNDQPLETGVVGFVNGNFFAKGYVKKDGTYTIGSTSEADGLPPGVYHVYLSSSSRSETAPDGSTKDIPLVDSKYTDYRTSGLTVEVTAKTKTFDFKVDRYVEKKE